RQGRPPPNEAMTPAKRSAGSGRGRRPGTGTSQAGHGVVAAWRTSHKATTYLIEHLPAAIWSMEVPGVPGRTIRTIAAHLHNSRCMWIKSLGARHGMAAPRRVDLRRVSRRELVRALARSSDGIARLIELGVAHGGRVPPATWQNFPTDLEHFLSY